MMRLMEIHKGEFIVGMDERDIGLDVDHPFGSVVSATLDGVPVSNEVGALLYLEAGQVVPMIRNGVITINDRGLSVEVVARAWRAVEALMNAKGMEVTR